MSLEVRCECCPGESSCISVIKEPQTKKRRTGERVPLYESNRQLFSRVTYRPLIVGAYEYFQKEMLNSLVTLKPKTQYETVTNQVKTKQKNYGDVRLANIRKYCDHVKGYDRSEMQKQFHESFLQCRHTPRRARTHPHAYQTCVSARAPTSSRPPRSSYRRRARA